MELKHVELYRVWDSRCGRWRISAIEGRTALGKPHPTELRSRVVAFVEEGHSNREVSPHFRVLPRFVNNLMKVKAETGSLGTRRKGHVEWVVASLPGTPSLCTSVSTRTVIWCLISCSTFRAPENMG